MLTSIVLVYMQPACYALARTFALAETRVDLKENLTITLNLRKGGDQFCHSTKLYTYPNPGPATVAHFTPTSEAASLKAEGFRDSQWFHLNLGPELDDIEDLQVEVAFE
ncbi:hypothetical protein BJ875DRAFT_512313 [Amylocarpus encephaloides]|uniref:Uncharacterized protein n=1 Tax=Amylocarpus encephaloides TaxID=45428 RepID=A0A9P8C917_9HELO|nr:hypothetical protein BJ875DRAFT_512313 [Amylocarpus encephaloides]